MAESSGEKTEMPTPKKLRDARQKGQVCQSKDIVSTALLVVLFAVLAWMGGALLRETQQLVATVGGRLADPAGGAVQACGALTILRFSTTLHSAVCGRTIRMVRCHMRSVRKKHSLIRRKSSGRWSASSRPLTQKGSMRTNKSRMRGN